MDIRVKTIFDYPSEQDRENEESLESVVTIPVKKKKGTTSLIFCLEFQTSIKTGLT